MRNELIVSTVPHPVTHSQDLKKLLLEILVKDRRARVITGEPPCHPVQQNLMKITPGGGLLAEYVQYPPSMARSTAV